MSELTDAELTKGALTELLSAVSDLARIVDSVTDCHADMPYVRSAIEAAGRHIAALSSPAPTEEG